MQTFSQIFFRQTIPSSEGKESSTLSWVAGLIVFFAVVVQLRDIQQPYRLAYETGFQERIARRHLDPGLEITKGISTLNNLGTEPTWHPTHPPLLQQVLALLYWILGDSEAVARIIPIVSLALVLTGLWRVSRWYLSPQGRLMLLAAAAVTPLAMYIGRIVNFESPTLACVVWTVVLLEEQFHRPRRSPLILLFIVTAAGSLLDWPYQLFVTCLAAAAWLRKDWEWNERRLILSVWATSMLLSIGYMGLVWGIGAHDIVFHHIRIQSGTYRPEAGWQPPLFLTWNWWVRLGQNLAFLATPLLALSLPVWGVWSLLKRPVLSGMQFWLMQFFLFFAAYFLVFSRASYIHYWCYFYSLPLLAIGFALLTERLKPVWSVGLAAMLLFFSLPERLRYFREFPLHLAGQIGRSIDEANNFLPLDQQSAMKGPLLYVNRVDSLAYYARCETAYMNLAVSMLPPGFLKRFRPEFFVWTGSPHNPAITALYTERLQENLQQFYTRTVDQLETQVWESLDSPFLSIMGMMQNSDASTVETECVEDRIESHIAANLSPGRPGAVIDLTRVPKTGRRWLHGWVIRPLHNSHLPANIAVKNHEGETIGSIAVVPQAEPARWQEFWLYLGHIPNRLELHWDGVGVRVGDWRLIGEAAWTDDLTRLLADEIDRQKQEQGYASVIRFPHEGQMLYPVLQHPGRGIDQVAVPPVRIGYNQSLTVTYGLHPRVYDKSDGAVFRLRVRDFALGTEDILLEDFVSLPPASGESVWRRKTFDLFQHSRHLLQFAFEVGPGPNGAIQYDHALWQEARIVDKKVGSGRSFADDTK